MEKNRFCSIGIAGLSLLFSFSTVLAQQREPQVQHERSSASRLAQQSDRKEVSANQGFSLMENSARIVPSPSRKMLGLPKDSPESPFVAAPPFQISPVLSVASSFKAASQKESLTFSSGTSTPRAMKSTGGTFEVPFFDDFDEDITYYTIIDNNSDGRTWMWDEEERAAFYRYSPDNKGDDWLVTPPIHLYAGKEYKVSFSARASMPDFPERIEAKWGKKPIAAELVEEIAPPTDLTSANYTSFSKTISPTESGNYYFGFHAISDANSFYLYLDSVSIENAADPAAPDSVTCLEANADPMGKLQATLTFHAPSKTIGQSPLSTLSRIEVKRNGELMATIASPAPGSEQTVVDGKALQGTNKYTITPYNEIGKGMERDISLYVGVDEPTAPVVKAQDRISSVKLVWDTVKGVNGGVVSPDSMVYDIYDVTHGEAMAEQLGSVKGKCEFEIGGLNTMADEEQNFLTYGVMASNVAGRSGFGVSSIIVGKPYTLPYHNSLKNATSEGKFIGLETEYGFSWGVVRDETYDADGGALAFTASKASTGTLLFGKMDLSGCKNPTLIFWYKTKVANPARLEICVQHPDNTIDPPLWSADFSNEENNEWKRALISLPPAMANEPYVILRMRGVATGDLDRNIIYVDNINITDPVQKDVAVEVEAPTELNKGQTAHLAINVINRGLDDVIAPRLKLTVNGEELYNQILEGEQLSILDGAKIAIDCPTSAVRNEDRLDVKAEVSTNGDLDESNNTSTATVALKTANVAAPTGLKASDNANAPVELNWEAPEWAYTTVTEDFESYAAWDTTFGVWSTIDADKGYAGKLSQNVRLPHEGEQYAFLNWQPSDYFQPGTGIDPHSGKKAAVAIYQYDESGRDFVAADNYLITPRLSGRRQTITFYVNNVRNTSGTSEESFEVMTSTTGKTMEDFRKLGDDYLQSDGNWTEISVEVPEGTSYLAIHHNTEAQKALLFMIDDITFEPSLAPESYNIYRDGGFLANVTGTSYTDKELLSDGQHKYEVTAVYADGSESVPVGIVILTDIIAIDATQPGDFNVYRLDGSCVFLHAKSMDGLRPGVYIVNGQKTLIRR